MSLTDCDLSLVNVRLEGNIAKGDGKGLIYETDCTSSVSPPTSDEEDDGSRTILRRRPRRRKVKIENFYMSVSNHPG